MTNQSENGQDLLARLAEVEREVVEKAKVVVKGASDPFSGLIKFLHQRPENEGLDGQVVEALLIESFGCKEEVPELIRAIAAKVRTIIRQSDVIKLTNEGITLEEWGKFVIKKKEETRFEVAYEKGELVLKNIKGLFGIEHGVELPLEKIQVRPPKLIVTAKMGLVRPQRVLDL